MIIIFFRIGLKLARDTGKSGNRGGRDFMVDIWQLGFVLYGARTIERRVCVHEVFSQESAFVHARDGVNSTAGVQCACGSSARFYFLSSPRKSLWKRCMKSFV